MISSTAIFADFVASPRQRASRMKVMQVTDWLEPGGKERVAVNLANMLPRERFDSYLCTTRVSSGGLEHILADDVGRLRLDRTYAIDLPALRRLVEFNALHEIDVLHAHGSSLFLASAASLFAPHPVVVWHDHYGPYRRDDRPAWLYRLAARRVGGVIAVNQALLDWSRRRLRIRPERTWYLPNFVGDTRAATRAIRGVLPGRRGARVACVAHLRPQKDHATLLRAFALVLRTVPDAHLLLIGGGSDASYAAGLVGLADRLGLRSAVTFLGQRDDVAAVLAHCDVGVLSSESEGFPLALIEYGVAQLAAVSTNVGQCPEILDHGASGLLVDAGDSGALAAALAELLSDDARRRSLSLALHARVRECYSAEPLLERVCGIYDTVRSSAR